MGVGVPTEPELALEWSNDGGRTWVAGPTRTLGAEGTRGRAVWHRLGAARDRVYRCRCSEPVRIYIQGTELGVEPTDA